MLVNAWRFIWTGVVVGAFIYGLANQMAGWDWTSRNDPEWMWVLSAFALATVPFFSLIRWMPEPWKAFRDIDAVRRAEPDGKWSAKNLQWTIDFLTTVGLAVLACAIGQGLRAWRGLDAHGLWAMLFMAASWLIGVIFCAKRLKVVAFASNISLERR